MRFLFLLAILFIIAFEKTSSKNFLKESTLEKNREENKLYCFYPLCFYFKRWVSNGKTETPDGCSAGIAKGTNFGWTHCCNQHDSCWGDCGKTQSFCDNQFHNCMKSVCDSKYKKWYQYPAKITCRRTADIWATAVKWNVCRYIEGQKRLCKCA